MKTSTETAAEAEGEGATLGDSDATKPDGEDAGGNIVALEHPENSNMATADQTKLVQIA